MVYLLIANTLLMADDYLRRKHRKIAMWLLNSKAVDTYAGTIDYEAHMLARSLYEASLDGGSAVNPAYFAGRFALKYVNIERGPHTYSPHIQQHAHSCFRYTDRVGF